MEYYVNPNKQLTVVAGGETFIRSAIRTHFIGVGERYLDIVRRYVLPVYQKGDVLSISEKIIALCQGRVIYRKDVRVGFWARLLARFVLKTPAGFSVGNPLKMQVAIQLAGLPRVLFAAICSAVTKPFGLRGVFYRVVGHDVNGLDGFYGGAYPEYEQMGILNPTGPERVCAEIERELGVLCAIADANDLGVNILARSPGVPFSEEILCQILRDNPAGQDNQQTPFILIRKSAVPPENTRHDQ